MNGFLNVNKPAGRTSSDVVVFVRRRLPKARVEMRGYYGRNATPEYVYANYDVELAKQDYEILSRTIIDMQMALDQYNQTVQFDVDI